MGQSRPLFVYFCSFLVTISIQIEKSVDGKIYLLLMANCWKSTIVVWSHWHLSIRLFRTWLPHSLLTLCGWMDLLEVPLWWWLWLLFSESGLAQHVVASPPDSAFGNKLAFKNRGKIGTVQAPDFFAKIWNESIMRFPKNLPKFELNDPPLAIFLTWNYIKGSPNPWWAFKAILNTNKARTGPRYAARFCKISKLCNKFITIENTSTWGTQMLVIIV